LLISWAYVKEERISMIFGSFPSPPPGNGMRKSYLRDRLFPNPREMKVPFLPELLPERLRHADQSVAVIVFFPLNLSPSTRPSPSPLLFSLVLDCRIYDLLYYSLLF